MIMVYKTSGLLENLLWWNKQAEKDAVFERLDRVMVLTSLIKMFPELGILHMPSDMSNHVPIKIIDLLRSESKGEGKKVQV